MTPEQFKRASEIFLVARRQSIGDRPAYLEKACVDDALVRREVERMLDFDSDDSMDDAAVQLSATGGAPTPADEVFPPGTRIGEYTVVRTLGEGGMGRVLEVQQAHPRRRVALKLLRQEALSRSMLQRFDHEVRILGEMQHEGIARIHAAGRTDGKPPQPFFTMELIEGSPLTEYAQKHRLSTRDRLKLIATVCDAVQYAHQRGVVHRDLKPANILVTDGGKPKIVDFGIARIADSDMAANTLRTATGQIIGTLPYMSPEQVSGDPGKVDSRTDVYAIGVILYEMLSGSLPHDLTKRSLPDAARVVQESSIPRLGTRDRTLRGDVETIVAKALEKDPERRYASASELAADIRRYLADQPIIARPTSAVYQLRKFASRHRAAAISAIAIGLTLIGATIFSSIYAIRAERARVEAVRVGEEADRARKEAERQADIADAINEFLNKDLLASVAPTGSGRAGRGKDVRMSEVLNEATRRIDAAGQPGGAFADQPEVEAAIRLTLGRTLMRLGDVDAAYPQLVKSYDLRKASLGEANANTMASAIALGGVLFLQNRLDESAEVFQRARRVGTEARGADDSLVLTCEYGYANVLLSKRRSTQALELLNHVLNVQQKTLSPDDLETLGTRQKIALVYKRQGRYADAEPIERDVLARFKSEFGADDPKTLRVEHNLGTTLYYAKKYAEAEAIFRDVLEKRKRVLGADHYETLSTRLNLGSVLVEQGRPAEAEPVYRAGYEATLARYGPKNERLLSFAFGLANALRDLHRYDEAESLYQETTKRGEETDGLEAKATIQVLVGLFDMRMMQGRTREAEEILARPVAALRKSGKLAENTRCVEPLIACRIQLGMHSAALDLARAYASAIDAKFGPASAKAVQIHQQLDKLECAAARSTAAGAAPR